VLISFCSFHSFFSHVDNYRTPIFLYLSSKGLEACGAARTEPVKKRDMSRRERAGGQRRRASTPPLEKNGESAAKPADAGKTVKVE
jgi:hypothetical protein